MPTFSDVVYVTRIVPLLMLGFCLTGCPTNGGGEGEGEGEGEGKDTVVLEQDAVELINEERAAVELSALSVDVDLQAVARAHSEDMLARDYFDHENPEGQSPFDRLDAAGITYERAGESITWNNDADPAQAAIDTWLESTGQEGNMFNANFTLTGMGVAGNDTDGYYFTQIFAQPRVATKDHADVVVMESHYLAPTPAISE